MNTLVEVLQFLWNLGSDYILFTMSFAIAMGVCTNIIGLVRK